MRDRYASDPEFKAAHKQKVRESEKKRRSAARLVVDQFRATGCSLCPETEQCCLVAHHVEPGGKDFNIARAMNGKYAETRLRKELQKCVCLCANCHAKVHAGKPL